MEIRQIPENYAPLSGPLHYMITDSTPKDFDVEVINYGLGEVVGVKRMIQTNQVILDIAPYLRRQLAFVLKTGETGFVNAAGRVVSTAIRIGDTVAPERIFTPAAKTIVPPALLTTMPTLRSIAPDECDELTFCTTTPCTVQVNANTPSGPQLKTYTATQAGLSAFRLNAADFPQAKMIVVNAADAGMVTYYVRENFGVRRLAWRSAQGSVEHYTFSVEKGVGCETEKEHLFTTNGYKLATVKSRRTMTLMSAYEPREIIEPLAEICTSPAVWCIENGVYIPVEVVSELSGIRTRATLRNMEVCIRFAPQTQTP